MNAANLVAYAAPVTLVVLACAGLPRLLGLRAPGPQYAFWRLVLAVCVLLPLLQPWQPGEMIFVPGPDPGGPVSSLPPPARAPAVAAPATEVDWVAAAQMVILTGKRSMAIESPSFVSA